MSKQTTTNEVYGRSPGLEALEDVRFVNNLPPEERARAAAAFVRGKIEDGTWQTR